MGCLFTGVVVDTLCTGTPTRWRVCLTGWTTLEAEDSGGDVCGVVLFTGVVTYLFAGAGAAGDLATRAMGGAGDPGTRAVDTTARATGAVDAATRAIGAVDVATLAIGAVDVATLAVGADDAATRVRGAEGGAIRGLEADEAGIRVAGAVEDAIRALGAVDDAIRALGAVDGATRVVGAEDAATRAAGVVEGTIRGVGGVDPVVRTRLVETGALGRGVDRGFLDTGVVVADPRRGGALDLTGVVEGGDDVVLIGRDGREVVVGGFMKICG